MDAEAGEVMPQRGKLGLTRRIVDGPIVEDKRANRRTAPANRILAMLRSMPAEEAEGKIAGARHRRARAAPCIPATARHPGAILAMNTEIRLFLKIHFIFHKVI